MYSNHDRDTWKPKVFGGAPSKQASINHGTYFYHAAQEGLLANDTNIHAGIRTTLSGPSDYENDGYCGFEIVEAREIDKIGTDGIIKKIRDRVGTTKPVYLSIDIDTLDPACKFLHAVVISTKLTNLQLPQLLVPQRQVRTSPLDHCR
jgi:agmatinase